MCSESIAIAQFLFVNFLKRSGSLRSWNTNLTIVTTFSGKNKNPSEGVSCDLHKKDRRVDLATFILDVIFSENIFSTATER